MYGVACLGLGTILILAQVFGVAAAKKETHIAEATTRAKEAARQAKSAARQARLAAITTREALANVPTTLGQEGIAQVSHAQEVVEAAASEAAEAEDSADEAAKAAADTGKYDVLTALASRAPLALGGGLLIALGALIMGFIDLTATASTG